MINARLDQCYGSGVYVISVFGFAVAEGHSRE